MTLGVPGRINGGLAAVYHPEPDFPPTSGTKRA
jgi:hypothetical protein